MAAKRTCPAIFVTGTDTGVGKTMVTAALAHHFTARGLKVGVMKPIETGVEDTAEPGEDAALLCWSAGSTDDRDAVSPYRYQKPLAPCQAASAAGEQIDAGRIFEAFNRLVVGKDLVLVEGAGGLMVPITGGYLMADLARDLNLPVMVVSHPRLGTLNHTILTTFAATAMELQVCGFLVNRMPDMPGEAEEEAPHLLASLASADLLGVLPEVSGTDHEKVVKLSAAIGALPAYRWLTTGIGIDL